MDNKQLKPTVSNIFNQLVFRFKEHDVAALSAQMTYYMVLSVFPFLLVLFNILAWTGLSDPNLLSNISSFMPGETGEIITDVIGETIDASSASFMSISMLAALWTSSNGVGALIKGVNKAYDLKESRPFWRVKGIAILFTLGLIGMIVILLVMLVMGKFIGAQIFKLMDTGTTFNIIWEILKYAIPLGGLVGIFVLFYRFTPVVNIKTRHVLFGTFFTTFGWIGISQLFSTYVSQFGNYTKVYGSIGGIIIFLIWLYLSSIIILTGGELNATITYLHSDNRSNIYETAPSINPFRKR